MGIRQFNRRWALCLIFGTSLLTTGCQSVRGAHAQHVPSLPPVPPLSTSPEGAMQTGAQQSPAAPSQIVDARYSAANSTMSQSPQQPPLLSPQQAQQMGVAGYRGAMPSHRGATSGQYQPQPQQPQPQQAQYQAQPSQPAQYQTQQAQYQTQPAQAQQIQTQPGQVQQVQAQQVSGPQGANCLPAEAEWREQMEEQNAALLLRLSSLEKDLTTTQKALQSVNHSLQESQQRIEELNQEVAHWKGKVQELEIEMKTQQLNDLKSLDELTTTLHQVLIRQGASSQLEQF